MKPTVYTAIALLLLACVTAFAYWRSRKPPSSTPVADQASPSQPFEWPAGVTMEAIVPTDVILPGSILGNDEVFGSVIQVSGPNAPVYFVPSTTPGVVFKTITVRLEPGTRLKLTKAAEVWVRNVGGKPGDEFYMRLIENP